MCLCIEDDIGATGTDSGNTSRFKSLIIFFYK
jgi:hypothetical protein